MCANRFMSALPFVVGSLSPVATVCGREREKKRVRERVGAVIECPVPLLRAHTYEAVMQTQRESE